LTDFGTANISSRIHVESDEPMKSGAMAFASPEVILGEPVDERSDLYSFGVVLYVLLAGRPPFQHERVEDLMEQIIIKRATPLRQIQAEIPRELEHLVEQLMSKEPEARIPSAREVEEALQEIPR
jgi:eukaryotic-like serine/threonine-protein kinase